MKQVRLTEVFGEDKALIRIEAHDLSGQHQLDILWDPHDENNETNRKAFREWAITMLKRKQLEPIN